MKSKALMVLSGSAVLFTGMIGSAKPIFAATTHATTPLLTDSATQPVAAPYGYFVDTYKNNTTSNESPTTNPTIGLLSEVSNYYTPENTGSVNGNTDWNVGTVDNPSIIDQNLEKCIEITSHLTDAEKTQTYLDDRRNQSYTIASTGLGVYRNAFLSLSDAQTQIPDTVPADATTVQYNDGGDWASTTSQLGAMVQLVNTLRGSYSSTTPSKNYFNMPRPFRWLSGQMSPSTTKPLSVPTNMNIVLPTLVPEESSTPATDGEMPSGHTNAGYLTAFALAYAAPQEYDQLLMAASDLGNARIQAGMHSPLAVMAGRMTGTALAAAILNDPANSSLESSAYNEAQNVLLTSANANSTDFDTDDYAKEKATYIKRLTYGFSQTGNKNLPMVVPKGAEVLLQTRFPYLNADQRRWVLYSTGLPSGYPLLDDAEGWGRLDLFAAANGYGAFDTDVTVDMDASQGGFNKLDAWKNDISGPGSLTKEGTGQLDLQGKNTYTGGTVITGGVLEADSNTAFGSGDVSNMGGTINEFSPNGLNVDGDFEQSQSSTLNLNVGNDKDILNISGQATLGGQLNINLLNGYVPSNNATIIKFGGLTNRTKFSSIVVNGLPSGYEATPIYENNQIVLSISPVHKNSWPPTGIQNLVQQFVGH